MKRSQIFVQTIEFQRNPATGFAMDSHGTIYISDFSNTIHCLTESDAKPIPSFFVPGECVALAWNQQDTLFMCDCNHKIWKLERDSGDVSLLVGSNIGHQDGKFENAKFFYPRGIAIDNNSNLFIADQHCIRKISRDNQTVDTIAGCPPSTIWETGGHKDGTGKEARFNSPTGIAVNKDGVIFITDSKNHCIRTIEDGIVSTIAGLSKQAGNSDGTLEEAKFKLPRGLYLDKDDSLLVADSNGLRRIDWKRNRVTTVLAHADCFAVYKDRDGNILLGAEYKLLRLYQTWNTERLLWIGMMKEDPSCCMLSRLPKDMIKEIAAHLKPSQYFSITTK